MKPLWDIFCRVVDNFGDIGVCWRLARQLATEYPIRVRLWVDKPEMLAPLLPGFDPAWSTQDHHGVTLCRWCQPLAFNEVAEVVIEAFACNPPPEYLAAMGNRARPPCWVNLEYLSAEPWVAGCHGAASPHPTLPLVKYFFFPGFSAGTGGLLREQDLLARRNAFRARQGNGEFLHTLGITPNPAEVTISLFCYDTAPVAELLDVWLAEPTPILCLIPPGKPQAAVSAHLGNPEAGSWQRNQLRLIPIPFLPQSQFDELLWSCDLNFVRGEDSFVRGLWAATPLVWNIYPQEDAAHGEKLEAFLSLYGTNLALPERRALENFWRAWNGLEGHLDETWTSFLQALPRLHAQIRPWHKQLENTEDLTCCLVKFCESRV